MATRITVHLSDELVAYIDAEIERGNAISRADVVAKALVRERRHRRALADVAILRNAPGDPDLDGLAEYAGAHPVSLDD